MRLNAKNDERLAAWKIRYHAATGIKPTDKPHNVAPCFFCYRPVWRPVSMGIKPWQHFCGSENCTSQLVGYVEALK